MSRPSTTRWYIFYVICRRPVFRAYAKNTLSSNIIFIMLEGNNEQTKNTTVSAIPWIPLQQQKVRHASVKKQETRMWHNPKNKRENQYKTRTPWASIVH